MVAPLDGNRESALLFISLFERLSWRIKWPRALLGKEGGNGQIGEHILKIFVTTVGEKERWVVKIVPCLQAKLIAFVFARMREITGEATSCAMTLTTALV